MSPAVAFIAQTKNVNATETGGGPETWTQIATATAIPGGSMTAIEATKNLIVLVIVTATGTAIETETGTAIANERTTEEIATVKESGKRTETENEIRTVLAIETDTESASVIVIAIAIGAETVTEIAQEIENDGIGAHGVAKIAGMIEETIERTIVVMNDETRGEMIERTTVVMIDEMTEGKTAKTTVVMIDEMKEETRGKTTVAKPGEMTDEMTDEMSEKMTVAMTVETIDEMIGEMIARMSAETTDATTDVMIAETVDAIGIGTGTGTGTEVMSVETEIMSQSIDMFQGGSRLIFLQPNVQDLTPTGRATDAMRGSNGIGPCRLCMSKNTLSACLR